MFIMPWSCVEQGESFGHFGHFGLLVLRAHSPLLSLRYLACQSCHRISRCSLFDLRSSTLWTRCLLFPGFSVYIPIPAMIFNVNFTTVQYSYLAGSKHGFQSTIRCLIAFYPSTLDGVHSSNTNANQGANVSRLAVLCFVILYGIE